MVDADSEHLPEQATLTDLAFAHADSEIPSSHDTAQPAPAVSADATGTDLLLASTDVPRAGRRVKEQEQAVPSRVPPGPRLLPPPPGDHATYLTYRTDLAKVRALVLQRAKAAGLTESKANDLVLAVSEVAANTLRHTQSAGILAIWLESGEIVCEINDEGTITDPLAGQRKPGPDADGGHGLWLVYQVCDLVELRSDDAGTAVRMHMKIGLPAS